MNIKIKLKIILAAIVFITTNSSAMEFTLQGRVDELYDDNINASSVEPESDWVTNLMIGAGIRSEMRSLDFDLSGHVYQQYYPDHEELNANYQDLLLNLTKSFSENVILRMSDVFQNYPGSKSLGTLFDRGEANTAYISNNFSSGLDLYATSKLFFTGVYSNSILKNDDPDLPDTVLHSPGGGIGYSFDTANIIRTGYLYSLMKYDDGEESRGDRGFAEYEKYFTKQFRAIVHGGYDYIQTSEGESRSSRWRVSIIDDVDRNNQLEISYMKESTISNISNDIFKNWRIDGQLRREISDRIGISTSVFYGDGTYKFSGVNIKLAGGSVSVAFAVTEFINLNAGYAYTWSSTTTPGIEEASYDRNQISAGLSAAY